MQEARTDDTSLLPDILAPNLDVVFVGAAPSAAAALSGHYYAGRRNRFWDLLYMSGLTPVRLDAYLDYEVLRYGIGLTAVFLDRISTANALLPKPDQHRLDELMRRLHMLRPRVVCYNGKDVCRMCTDEVEPPWGELPDMLGASAQFVVPSSSGRADRWRVERLQAYCELKALVDTLRKHGEGRQEPYTDGVNVLDTRA
jgi:TDG/mug DNA glycosylase family protein